LKPGVTKPSEVECAWLAGLVEGEGYFNFTRSPTIGIGMTDRDVIDRVSVLWGTKVYAIKPRASRPTAKQCYRVIVCGKKALAWMDRIYPFMGNRRRAKIDEGKKEWERRRLIPRNSNRTVDWNSNLSAAALRRWARVREEKRSSS
jgi:hypothetical protein